MESSDFATKYTEQFILLEYNSGRSDRMVYLRKNSNRYLNISVNVAKDEQL